MAAPRPASPKVGLTHLAVLIGYLLLTVVMTWPLARQLNTAIPGDSFDGWQNYWNLWWVKLALVDQLQNPYVTDLLYYPTGVGLYFHTLNPFNGLASLPVQVAGGLIPAYNFVVMLSWVLAGYGVYLLARWVMAQARIADGVVAPIAAFVAGAIFTFAPVHMAHLLGHMQVLALQWLPFYLLALLRGMQRAQQGRSWWRDGLLAGLFLALAGLCDWYFVLYLFLFTGVAVIWAWASPWANQWRSQATFTRRILAPVGPPLLAGGLFLLLLAPILVPMVNEAMQFSFMVRPASDLYILSASVADFIIPNRLHTLFRPDSLTWPGNQIAPVSERTISLGYGALALALVGLAGPRRVWLWGIAALFFLLLALGPQPHVGNITWAEIPATPTGEGWSLYALLNEVVPFMRISRSVSRFAILVQLCVAVLAGVGLGWLGARLRPRLAGLGEIVALALVLAESWVAPYPMSPPDTPAYYTQLAQEPETEEATGAVLNLPMNYDRPGYLLYQTVHQRPLTVAYISRDDPRTLTERVPLLQHLRHLGPDILADDPVQVGLTVLHDLEVDIVVLDRYKMPEGKERAYTTALANAVMAGQTPVYADERITVYQTPALATPQPYLLLGPLHWGPLQQEGDLRYRSTAGGPAELILRHAPPGAQVVITYRTSATDTRVEVAGVATPLPPTTTAATITVAMGEADQLTFYAPDGELEVVELRLILPD